MKYRPWKGPIQVRGPEALVSLADGTTHPLSESRACCFLHTYGSSDRAAHLTRPVSLPATRATTPAPSVLPTLLSLRSGLSSRDAGPTGPCPPLPSPGACSPPFKPTMLGWALSRDASLPGASPWPGAHTKDTASFAAAVSVSQREARGCWQRQTAHQPRRGRNPSHVTGRTQHLRTCPPNHSTFPETQDRFLG